MSQLQRVIVRFGVESDIPALRIAELGWDIDTKTFRIGDDTDTPTKVLTTKSTGDFDFTSSSLVKFNNVEVNTLNGIDFESLNAAPGILVRSSTSGEFSVTSLESSDGSVDIVNNDGLNGPIDIRISTQSLRTALAPIIEDIETIREQVVDLGNQYNVTVQNLSALTLLSGEPVGATTHADFERGVIPPGSTTRQALQILENYAYFVANEGADTLLLQNRTITEFEIALGTGSTLEIPAAEQDKAGLLSGADKRKLDYLNITGNVAVADIGVKAFEVNASNGRIVNSNDSYVTVPSATPSAAGLLTSGDKGKLNLITITNSLNLDQISATVGNHENRLINQENAMGNLLNNTIPNINNNINYLAGQVNQALNSGSGLIATGMLSTGEIEYSGSTDGKDGYLVVAGQPTTGEPRLFVNCGNGSVELRYGLTHFYVVQSQTNYVRYFHIVKINNKWYGGYAGFYQYIGDNNGSIYMNTLNFSRITVTGAVSI